MAGILSCTVLALLQEPCVSLMTSEGQAVLSASFGQKEKMVSLELLTMILPASSLDNLVMLH